MADSEKRSNRAVVDVDLDMIRIYPSWFHGFTISGRIRLHCNRGRNEDHLWTELVQKAPRRARRSCSGRPIFRGYIGQSLPLTDGERLVSSASSALSQVTPSQTHGYPHHSSG